MQTFALVTALAFAAGGQALIAGRSNCCFYLAATGGVSGTVGQLSDGQNRIGGNLSEGQYCIDSNGGLTDQNGRGCILTPPTTQFQCDTEASPTSGFSVGCTGQLSSNGNGNFYVCPTGENGEGNIYTESIPNQNCVEISLSADSCQSGCPALSVTAVAPSASPSAAPQASTAACPAALSGAYEYPHLIVPVNSASPNQAYGTSYNGTVTSTISSIFNFDIPSSDSGKTCSLVFLFPTQSNLQTSSFTFSGNGGIDFSLLSGNANPQTTYSNAPKVSTDYGVTTVAPGNDYTIATFNCPAGQTVSYKLSASGDTSLYYFQDYNPSPIGLYITKC
ncbi:MAG: hypothetical protein M1827_002022 [Pycnora praestabilis]|nr:MAG: hypothetical protein M1827_002022 [Pycnora praestabilis]